MNFTDIKKIAIFRALHLGDLICTIPAFRSIRYAFPTAEITLIGLPWSKKFQLRYQRYIDNVVIFPGYPGLPEQQSDPANISSFIDQMQQEHFDLIFQMHGNGTIVNTLMEELQARFTVGFHPEESEELFLKYPEHLHEIYRHLNLLSHLNIPIHSAALDFPVTEIDYHDFYKILEQLPEGEYICVHPGSRGEWRQWPISYFAAIADHLSEMGYKIVLTGVAEERPIIREVIANMRFPALDLSGKTSLGSLAILLRKARALVCNCTGVSHLAAITNTPSIVISMDGEPHRWAPLNQHLHYTIDWTRQKTYGNVERLADQLLQTTKTLFS